jgi:hypothetical protein
MLIVARHLTQRFEWECIDRLRSRPASWPRRWMRLLHRALATIGVADETYRSAVKQLEERGVVELVSLIGYFIIVSLVMDVAHTLAPSGVGPLEPFPK